MASDGKEEVTMPSNAQIKKAAYALAWSPKIDLDEVKYVEFRHILSKEMGVDLSPRRKVVSGVLNACKAEWNEASEVDDSPRKAVATSEAAESISTDSPPKKSHSAKKFISADSPKKSPSPKKLHRDGRDHRMSSSSDLKQVRNIPHAPDLSWEDSSKKSASNKRSRTSGSQTSRNIPREAMATADVLEVVSADSPKQWEDPFFEKETEDLVAVFDHDHDGMFRFHMKKILLTGTLPRILGLLFAIILVVSVFDKCDAEDADDNNYYQQDNTYDQPDNNDYYQQHYDDWYLPDASYGDESYSQDDNSCGIGGIVRKWIVLVFWFGMGCLFLPLYGHFRLIKSQVYALHMAVYHDGVRAVYDDHLEGSALLAALHCWHLLVTRKDETVSSEAQDVARSTLGRYSIISLTFFNSLSHRIDSF
jgi:hypothetical protein